MHLFIDFNLTRETLNISRTNYRETPGVIPNLTYINLEDENMYGSVKQKCTKKVNTIT